MFDSRDKRALKQQIQDLQDKLKVTRANFDQAISAYRGTQSDKWEYHIEESMTVAQLAEYGIQGWELASAYSYPSVTVGDLIGGGETNHYRMRYIFKRKLVTVPDNVAAEIYRHHDLQAIEAEIAGLQEKLNAMK